MRPAQIVTRNNAVVDPFYGYHFSWCHLDSPNNFGFSILDFGLSEEESGNRLRYLLFMFFSPNRKPVLSNAEGSAIENLKSLSHVPPAKPEA
jgi:hypothetical protein